MNKTRGRPAQYRPKLRSPVVSLTLTRIGHDALRRGMAAWGFRSRADYIEHAIRIASHVQPSDAPPGSASVPPASSTASGSPRA